MTVSDHIFWKNKELAEETRSANLAVAAFVKVGITHSHTYITCLGRYPYHLSRSSSNAANGNTFVFPD
jgi:hypothetical protein